jgi:S1-C subfamily serine protease
VASNSKLGVALAVQKGSEGQHTLRYCFCVILFAVFALAVEAQSNRSIAADEQWLEQTCPRSWGPSTWKSCIDRNRQALNNLPSISDLSAADKQWLEQTCPRSWGPSTWKSCIDRNKRALVSLQPTQPGPWLKYERSNQSAPPDGTERPERSEPLRRPGSPEQERPVFSELTRSAQDGLIILGYDVGLADGFTGPRTMAAVAAFQRDMGMPETGIVSPDLIIKIGAAIGIVAASDTEPEVADTATGKTGSGFVISKSGHLLTNAHVVSGCRSLTAGDGRRISPVAVDEIVDLAILRIADYAGPTAKFRKNGSVRLGEDIIVVGFPYQGLLSSGLSVTKGSVSALAGISDDGGLIQISAPVQAGNSGGPALDSSGHVIGVVVSKLDAIEVLEALGDVPQNVNFAIAQNTAEQFIADHGLSVPSENSFSVVPTADIASSAEQYTVMINCEY